MKLPNITTILLTGGAGYIGSHIALECIRNGFKVIIFDNFSRGRKTIQDDIYSLTGVGVIVEEGDITSESDIKRCFEKYSVDGVVHLAGLKNARESSDLASEYSKVNITGTQNIVEAVLRYRIKRLVFSSSAAVYGNSLASPVHEEQAADPVNHYGHTKLEAEKIIERNMENAKAAGQCSAVILRYFNPVGKELNTPFDDQGFTENNNVFPSILNSLRSGGPFFLYGDDFDTRDGSAVRDFIHVSDLAKFHTQAICLDLNENKCWETINIGVGRGYSITELIAEFERQIGRRINVVVKQRRAGDIASSVASTRKMQSCFQVENLKGLPDMIGSVLKSR